MRIGIVLHGPEIIDAGSAKRIIEIFKNENEVIAKLGGTMGRTAVLDSGLEDDIDISQGLTPSETIIALNDRIDLAILLNHGKTLETGRHFGRIVTSKLPARSKPLVHIERPDRDGRIFYYCSQAKLCAEFVRDTLVKYHENYNVPIEQVSPMPLYIRKEGNTLVRRISGAFPGENIRLNGVVIGTVSSHEPEIVCKDGRIVELRGINIKQHGLEKLKNKKIDLTTAKVKTGDIRRTGHKTRVIPVRSGTSYRKVAIIDHCAESTFELIKDAGLVITAGDDTTAIAADILTRFGIPVIGITDGDLDYVLKDSAVPAGSAIICVQPGFDDIVARDVFRRLTEEKQRINLKRDELLAHILEIAERYIVDVKYY